VCTLIMGLGVLGPGTLLLGANRDESPGRPSTGPARLHDRPPVVGGRDLVAGGTWLAVREARFVAALLNRRPAPRPETREDVPLRSRGLLCLDAASLGPPLDAPSTIDPGTGEPYPSRLDAALRLVSRARYAPCSLVGLEADGPSWVIAVAPDGEPIAHRLDPGWHVITHADLDDEGEPRTRALRERLRGAAPGDADEALGFLRDLLRDHGGANHPPVCLHGDRFPTVSSTLIALGGDLAPRYEHAGGPPCVTPYVSHAALVDGGGGS
jgi:hypothetical protein